MWSGFKNIGAGVRLLRKPARWRDSSTPLTDMGTTVISYPGLRTDAAIYTNLVQDFTGIGYNIKSIMEDINNCINNIRYQYKINYSNWSSNY